MITKEKHYIKKCHCGTEIIYTRSDCHYDYHSDLYGLYCPSCHYEHKYQYRVYGDLFDEEYEEDSVDKDKDKEIERLNNKLKMIKNNIDTITKKEILDIIENYTGFFGKKSNKVEKSMSLEELVSYEPKDSNEEIYYDNLWEEK